MMTMRDFLNAVISEVSNDEIVEKAKSELAKMDAKNAKRSASPSKVAIANEPIKERIVAWLGNESNEESPKVASEIAHEVEISTQKASALCRQLTNDGVLTSTEVKVKGRGKMKGYFIA